jgi:hypothetical protein
MPDFAPNVTARYRLKYNVVGRQHTVMCRGIRDIDVSTLVNDAKTYLRAVFDALKADMASDLAFISADYALTDSDIFLPTTVPTAVVGGTAVAGFSKQDSITHLTFSGRGVQGSKVTTHIYGYQTSPDTLPVNIGSDFVFTGAENAAVAAAVVALNTSPSGRIVAIDNTPPVYANRATIKVNDFWLRKVRQGL